MNRKRFVCLLLAALLLAAPFVTWADTEQRVRNDGTEPVNVYAQIEDPTPARTLGLGQEMRYLGDCGHGWHQVQTLDRSFTGFLQWTDALSFFVVTVATPSPTPTPTPTPSATPEVTASPTPEVTASPTPEVTASPTPEVTASPTPEVTPSATPEVTASPTPEVTASPTPEVTPSSTPEVTASATPGVTPSSTPELSPSPVPEETETPEPTTEPTAEPTSEPTIGPTSEPTPAPTSEPTFEPTPEPTAEPTSEPTPAPTSEPTTAPTVTPTPRPGGASETELVIDTAHIYPGMAKSYADGYLPTVSGDKALFVLPLLGDVMGDVVRVTPDISLSGPFLYGNYQFDLEKSTQTATDSAGNKVSREVFLVRLDLALAKNRYNGTYPLTFQVSYTDKNGDPTQQDFTLQVTITDGKNPSAGGGGGGPTAVKKPVLVLTEGQTSVNTIAGGESFTLSLQVKNVGDLEAKNVRILSAADGQGIYRSDSLAPVFLSRLEPEESAEISFPFASDKTVYAGRHSLSVTLSYEDKYSNIYGDTVPLQINVTQEAAIGFDEMKLPETLTSGDTFTQPVCVYNTGYAPVYNVRCTLKMDGLIAASAFLGTLEPQQSADKAVSVFVTTLPGKEKYGAAYGELAISYEDMAGQEHTEYQQLRTTIQAPVEITDEEKLKQEQEQKEQQTLSQWWVSLLVAIAFILILLSGIVIARFTRMLKMK